LATRPKFAGVGASFTSNTGSLLNDASRRMAIQAASVKWLPVEQVLPNPEEDDMYDINALDALARDIAQRGIQNPLQVTPVGEEEYRIIGGHRRRAANIIAVEKYGYTSGEKIPCIICDAPKEGREFESTEAMILDNLQREKTDFNRMMEIIKFKACTEQRKALGEDIPVVRERVKERLGVSDTEITRFEKIYKSLHPQLMPSYREQKITTYVAYEIARMDEAVQQFIVEQWDANEPLHMPLMNAITAKYYDNLAKEKKAEEEKVEAENSPAEKVPAKKETVVAPKPESIGEGMDMLQKSFTHISAMLGSEQAQQLNKKDTTKILKRIQKEMSVLLALQNDLARLGLTGGVSDGE